MRRIILNKPKGAEEPLTSRYRRRRQSQRAAWIVWPWIGATVMIVLVLIVISRCTTGATDQTALPPAVALTTPAPHTNATGEQTERATGSTTSSPATHAENTSPAAAPDTPTAAVTACDYYAGPDDPAYVMHDGFIDWGSYWGQANAYVLQRTARYTPDERMLATAIWSEQKTLAETDAAAAARRNAMVAIGYIILHRRDVQTGWFGSTNTLEAVLNDTRQDIQFQGYWRWRNRDVVHDYLLHKVSNGRVVQAGIGWESPDRALWFEALDVARGVVRGCEPDTLPDSLFFGHGPIVRQMMERRAREDSSFEYHGIPDPQLWMSNKPFRW